MATGYNADGSIAVLADLGWISPAGQMFSTTRDLDIVSDIIMAQVYLVAVLVVQWTVRQFFLDFVAKGQ